MKQIVSFLAILILCSCYLHAHSVVLQSIDNEDGTMEIFGGFSTGQSAAGAKLIIRSQSTKKILYENRIPKSGTLIVKIPSESYTILLDSGPGHKLEKHGEIQPKEGFKNKTSKPIQIAFLTTLGISFVLIIASIILYRRRITSQTL